MEHILQGSLELREALAEEPAQRALFAQALLRTVLNGFSALATALRWTFHRLGQHPDSQQRVREEAVSLGAEPLSVRALPRLPFTRQVIQESLRLYPPAWMLGRQARQADTLGDTLIPPGAFVSVSPYTLHRYLRLWKEPDAFLPERFTRGEGSVAGAYIPFGLGLRVCPAEHLVVGPLQLLVATLVRSYQLRPDPGLLVRPRGLISLRPDPGMGMQLNILRSSVQC